MTTYPSQGESRDGAGKQTGGKNEDEDEARHQHGHSWSSVPNVSHPEERGISSLARTFAKNDEIPPARASK